MVKGFHIGEQSISVSLAEGTKSEFLFKKIRPVQQRRDFVTGNH